VKITVRFSAQLRAAAGEAARTVEATEGATVQEVIQEIAELYGNGFRSLLLDSEAVLQPSVLVFADGEQVLWDSPAPLRSDQTLIITTPIAGG
jgi:molybdopterin converting factor small subunit